MHFKSHFKICTDDNQVEFNLDSEFASHLSHAILQARPRGSHTVTLPDGTRVTVNVENKSNRVQPENCNKIHIPIEAK